jgi:DNA-binding CsgD family transcriptional regulator
MTHVHQACLESFREVDPVPEERAPHGALTAASPLGRILFDIFETMHFGAVLLDAQKRVLHMNARAQRCTRDALRVENGRLYARDRRCDVLFQTVLDQGIKYRERRTRERMREAVGVRREEGPCVIGRVIALSAEAQCELHGAALILVLVDPSDGPEPSHDILEQVFGLTRSESRVAGRLMSGRSLHEIARQAGTSPGTVRTQVKSVFLKTQTHRQPQLVGLLTRLAMISKADDED